jgi:hypothetical protein
MDAFALIAVAVDRFSHIERAEGVGSRHRA